MSKKNHSIEEQLNFCGLLRTTRIILLISKQNSLYYYYDYLKKFKRLLWSFSKGFTKNYIIYWIE